MTETFHTVAQRLIDIGKNRGDITGVSLELLNEARELKWAAEPEDLLASTVKTNWALDYAERLIGYWSVYWSLTKEQRESNYRNQQTLL